MNIPSIAVDLVTLLKLFTLLPLLLKGLLRPNLRSAEQKVEALNKVILDRADEVARANESNRKSSLEIEGLRSANASPIIKMDQLKADLAHQSQFARTAAGFQDYFYVC